jgi:hypothetical protein
MIEATLAAGTQFHNLAPSAEGPGHLSCMLYSAMVCPYLGGPSGRRGQGATAGGETIPRGEARGEVAGIVAHRSYDFAVPSRKEQFGFVYSAPIQIITYEHGDDLLDALTTAIADETPHRQTCPPWLLDDETAARAEATKRLQQMAAPGQRHPASDAKRSRRRQEKQARRRNR